MVTLIPTLLVICIVVSLALAAMTLFAQGYLYTETSAEGFTGSLWRAGAAGVVVTLFFAFWFWLDVSSPQASQTSVPYDALFRFSPTQKLLPEPAKRLWSQRKGDREPVEYKRFAIPQQTGQVLYQYKELTSPYRPWSPGRVEAVWIEHDGTRLKFEPRPAEDGGYPYFAGEDGWRMSQYETGVSGLPTRFHTGLFLANLLLNFLHLAVWFLCLWLLLRFLWGHALLLAFAIWAVMTVGILPWLLTRAAAQAAAPPAAVGPVQPAPAPAPAPKS